MYGSHSQYQKYIFLCHVLTDSVTSFYYDNKPKVEIQNETEYF